MNNDMHINTLHVYERLKKAKSFDAQARELAEILGSLVDDQLATKNDLIKLKIEIDGKIEKSKSETVKWVAGLLLAQAALIATLVKLL